MVIENSKKDEQKLPTSTLENFLIIKKFQSKINSLSFASINFVGVLSNCE